MADWRTYKFGSGLTIPEAEALVEKLIARYENSTSKRDPELIIEMLKGHLVRAVRDHKIEREVISACAAR